MGMLSTTRRTISQHWQNESRWHRLDTSTVIVRWGKAKDVDIPTQQNQQTGEPNIITKPSISRSLWQQYSWDRKFKYSDKSKGTIVTQKPNQQN
jgi:hypothetical protein